MATARSSIELTPRGRVLVGLAAVSLLGAWLSGDPNVRVAAALLTAPLLVDFVTTPRGLRNLSIHVAPRRTVVGAPFQESLRLHYAGRRPLRDLLVGEPRTRGRPTFLPQVSPGAALLTTLGCRSPVRSHLLERVFELHTDWPLGMFRSQAIAVVATDFVTEPAPVQLPAHILAATSERDPAPHTTSQLLGDEFHALREHMPSEEARGVHAMRSAALGSLVRTVKRGRLPSEISVVLDLRRPPSRPLGLGMRRFEWSLSACATLLHRLRSMHSVVRFWVIGTETSENLVQDPAHHREALTLLAETQACPHHPLDASTLDDIDRLEHCIWIPAGGYDAEHERSLLRAELRILGADS